MYINLQFHIVSPSQCDGDLNQLLDNHYLSIIMVRILTQYHHLHLVTHTILIFISLSDTPKKVSSVYHTQHHPISLSSLVLLSSCIFSM